MTQAYPLMLTNKRIPDASGRLMKTTMTVHDVAYLLRDYAQKDDPSSGVVGPTNIVVGAYPCVAARTTEDARKLLDWAERFAPIPFARFHVYGVCVVEGKRTGEYYKSYQALASAPRVVHALIRLRHLLRRSASRMSERRYENFAYFVVQPEYADFPWVGYSHPTPEELKYSHDFLRLSGPKRPSVRACDRAGLTVTYADIKETSQPRGRDLEHSARALAARAVLLYLQDTPHTLECSALDIARRFAGRLNTCFNTRYVRRENRT